MNFFKTWYNEACDSGKVTDPNTCCLSTCDEDLKPHSKFITMDDHTQKGFIWFSNYDNHERLTLKINPYATLNFWWPEFNRQVRAEGKVEDLSQEEAEEYWHDKPREWKLGILAG